MMRGKIMKRDWTEFERWTISVTPLVDSFAVAMWLTRSDPFDARTTRWVGFNYRTREQALTAARATARALDQKVSG
jgi:hypothetical protein